MINAKPVVVSLNQVNTMLARGSMWDKQSRVVKASVIILFIILVAGSVHYYNLYITETFALRLEAAQKEAEFQRKNTLIPELAKVVEENMEYERRVFVHAVDVRNALAPFMELATDGASHSMDMQTFTKLRSMASKFQAVSENYPILTSSETYLKLMLELANTETRLTKGRNSYNFAVTRYNTSLSILPGCLFGYFMGFKPAQTFIAEKNN